MTIAEFFKALQPSCPLKLETWNIPSWVMAAEMQVVLADRRLTLDRGVMNPQTTRDDPLTLLLIAGDPVTV